MKSLSHHIAHVKTKPHHIRKRVAFTAAGGITALVGLFWLVGSLAFGRFALPNNSFADAAGQTPSVIANEGDNANGNTFAGVASAFPDNETAKIQIVNVATSSTMGKKPEQTTIPF